MRVVQTWGTLRKHARELAATLGVTDTERAEIYARRWAELPESARTANQMVGRIAVGCEGTHGVFPRCNLTCSPCYHSEDANKVAVDGAHTVARVREQMAHLRGRRGARAHAQLIGGEVSLLDAESHAAALQEMRLAGREPMSFTHGDFDEEYLRSLALGRDGRPRFARLSFAAHFDSLMRGRRGVPRPRREEDLDPYRRRFVEMFERLRRDYGVRYYLAHNMTVTPGNVAEVEGVTRSVMRMGYSMLSFQPAAFVGDDRRWREGFRDVTGDDVWGEIERGAGTRLPWRSLQMGDPRCNRSAFGVLVGEKWIPFFDDVDPRDVRVRDAFLEHFTAVPLGGVPPWVAAARALQVAARHPHAAWLGIEHGWRLIGRAGGPRKMLAGTRLMTFVMHSFMDAAQVAPAWAMLQDGIVSEDPEVRAVQERLQACVYTMSHPEADLLVPACAQHSVYDPDENRELRVLLPIVEVRQRSDGGSSIGHRAAADKAR